MKPFTFILIIISFSLAQTQIDFSESSWRCEDPKQQSPINIRFYNSDSDIIYPAYPSHYINRTFYDLINDVKLTMDDDIFSIKPAEQNGNFGQLYVTIDKDYSSYSLNEIRFHVYSEHTFEKMKTEVEMQLIHTPNKDGNGESYLNLAISVFFSTSWDTQSEFLSVLFETTDPDSLDLLHKYKAAKITTLDLNQFFIKKDPYYYYTGSGTDHLSCNHEYHWFLMKKVQKMSWEQLYQLQSLLYLKYLNGNARKIKPKESSTLIEYIGNSSSLHFFFGNFIIISMLIL